MSTSNPGRPGSPDPYPAPRGRRRADRDRAGGRSAGEGPATGDPRYREPDGSFGPRPGTPRQDSTPDRRPADDRDIPADDPFFGLRSSRDTYHPHDRRDRDALHPDQPVRDPRSAADHTRDPRARDLRRSEQPARDPRNAADYTRDPQDRDVRRPDQSARDPRNAAWNPHGPADPRAPWSAAPSTSNPRSTDPRRGTPAKPATPTRPVTPAATSTSTPRHRGVPARAPRSHWILMAFMLIAIASMLLIGGVLNHQVAAEGAGGPHKPLGASGVPAAVSQGGPVIDARSGSERSLGVLPGKIALTFDDGPDPTWTPQVLAVLAKHHVPGTFFLVGAHVAEHPELVRAEVKAGDEVGVHTFTHSDLATAPDWQQSLEFSQTQLAIAGAAGVSTPLLRPPYSSEPDALDRLDWSAIQKAGHDGYLVVLTDRDSEDWRRAGVPAILANAIPPAPALPAKGKKAEPEPGFVLMFHDAGGDRSETVAALDQLIPQLQARGFEFTTVSGAVGAQSPLAPASSAAQWKGKGLLLAVTVSDFVVRWLGWAVLAAGAVGVLRILVLLASARRHAKRRPVTWGPPVRRPVSVIVPAYNEEAGIEATVESLSLSRHPIEIIVVDDGSTDRTAELVQRMIDGRPPGSPPLRLIQQVNSGKPAALNAGAARARGDILVMMDGDTVFEPDTIGHLVQPFADPSVGAVSGNAKVGNRTGILGRWQHIEYVVGFNLERRMYDLAGCMPTVPGAVGAFRRDALARVGGISQDTLAEDTDVTMAVIRDGWRVVYEERAVAWTEVPTTIRQFWRQRYRWCYGTLQAMWKHRRSVLRGGAEGRLGRRGLPYMLLFQVLLPLLAPVVDVYAIYGLIFNDAVRVGEVWLAFLLAQTLMALYAFRLDRERPTALWTLPLQQVVYRQLMYLVVIHSLVTAVVGTRLRWQRMQRHGSLEIPVQAAPR